MGNLGHVVVRVGSESRAALAYAASEAMSRGTRLVLVHAVEPGPDVREAGRRRDAGGYRLQLAAGQVAEWTYGRVEVTSRLVDGPAVEAIAAEARDAALVVLRDDDHGLKQALDDRAITRVIGVPDEERLEALVR